MKTSSDDEKPLDPAAARVVTRVRLLMIISGLTTMVAIAAVIGAIGYRVFRVEGSAGDVIATLPKGARVIATTVADDRIAVTIDIGGAIEVRLRFGVRSLRLFPLGRGVALVLLRGFQLLLAVARKLEAALVVRERVLERKLAAFHARHDFFQLGERLLESGA